MKKIGYAIAATLLVLITVVIYRTYNYDRPSIDIPPASETTVDEGAAQRLSEAVQIATVSYDEPGRFHPEPFMNMQLWLAENFPLCDSLLDKTVINRFSLLYHWKGSNPDLKPVVLMGHMDVVPIEESTADQWVHPPFSGAIADGYIWGRGTLDDKGSVIAILEATETLLRQGHEPERGIYLAFGHDEEIGGNAGAAKIAAHLESKGVEAAYVLDEGMIIAHGLLPGFKEPIALIGIAEKGFLTLELIVNVEGGHSSTPKPETSVTILTNAINRLVASPFKARISKPTQEMFRFLAPEAGFTQKMAFQNLWLFENMVVGSFEKSSGSNAVVRTTIAPTILEAGVKENVIPARARAVVNFRLLPGDSVRQVIRHVENVIRDERVQIRTQDDWTSEASPVSAVDSEGFNAIRMALGQHFPDVITAPTLVVGGTDAKHYTGVSPDIYRFIPMPVDSESLKGLHGLNERVKVEDYIKSIHFYQQLILNSTKTASK